MIVLRTQVEALSAQIEALEIQQREILDPQLLQQQLQKQLQHLQALKQQQQDERATTTTLREQYADLQQKLAAYEQQLKELQKQQLTMQQQLQQANCATEEASADLKLLERLKKQVIRDFADCDAVLTLNKDAGDNSAAAHDAAGSLDGHVTSGVTELQEMLTRAQQLHRQVSTLVVPDLPAAQQEACQSRLKQIAQFKDQAAALESAAAGLESRILASTEQVHTVCYKRLLPVCTKQLPDHFMVLHTSHGRVTPISADNRTACPVCSSSYPCVGPLPVQPTAVGR